MKPEIQVRTRNVLAVLHVPHVPRLTIERFSYLAQARRELAQLALGIGGLFCWNTCEEDEPVSAKLHVHVQKRLWIIELGVRDIRV